MPSQGPGEGRVGRHRWDGGCGTRPEAEKLGRSYWLVSARLAVWAWPPLHLYPQGISCLGTGVL